MPIEQSTPPRVTKLATIALIPLSIAALCVSLSACCGGSGATADYPVEADDFDLGAVMSLLKEDKVKEAAELEKLINAEDSSINNVDTDEDGKTDYIVVREEQGADGTRNLEFLAVPSATPTSEPDLIANIGFKPDGDDVEVEGGYPEYVRGRNDHYYHYRHRGLGSGLFMVWLMSPGRARYHPSYKSSYYGRYNRAVTPRSALGAKRGASYKSMKVSPIAKKARPAAYSVGSTRAKKTKSRFSSRKRTTFSRSKSKTRSMRKSGPSSRSRGFRSFGK